MSMLAGSQQLYDCLISLPWQTIETHDELVTTAAYALEKPRRVYLVDLPQGGDIELDLGNQIYNVTALNPQSGERKPLSAGTGRTRLSGPRDAQDAAFIRSQSRQSRVTALVSTTILDRSLQARNGSRWISGVSSQSRPLQWCWSPRAAC
jgi:hypothetical protein